MPVFLATLYSTRQAQRRDPMNSQHKLTPFCKLRSVRRLDIVAGTGALALAFTLTIVALAVPALAQTAPSFVAGVTVIYVDQDAAGAETGGSWEDAFATVQDALAAAVGAEIWVAEGIYYPDEGGGQTDGDRTAAFRLRQDVAIYGGFKGTEDLREQRDWVNNATVLSGDLDQNDSTDANGVVTNPADIVGTDNSYHVVTAEDVTPSAQLNGFVITGGLADSTTETAHQVGAGIYSRNAAPTLADLLVRGNKAASEPLGTPAGDGAGMYNYNGGPQFANITFRDNYAHRRGGGFYTADSGGDIANLTLQENEAGVSGGGMYVSTILGHTLSNLTLSGNSAGEYGGGLHIQSGVLSTLSDSLLTANTAPNGGGLYYSASVLRLNSVDLIDNEASELGGGMYVQQGQYWLTEVTFTGNDAGTAGGGLYSDRNVGSLADTTFAANTSALGGGMHVDAKRLIYASLTMNGVVFENNVATEDGGGLYVVNSTRGTLGSVSFLYNHAASGNGGGMCLISSNGYTLSNTGFEGNEAMSGGGMYAASATATFTEVTFEGNQAQLAYVDDTLGGGGISLLDGSNASFSGVTFSGNSAANGGGMLIAGSDPALANVSFVGNQAGDGISGSGGGLWHHEGSPTLTNVLFSANTATLSGGGMGSSGGDGSSVVLTNLTFSGKSAGGSGGALYTTSPDLSIHNTIIWNNRDASGAGTAGASIWDDPDAVIDHSLIQGQTPAGVGNLDGTDPGNDPLFLVPVDPGSAPSMSGLLTVKVGSPIIDAGDNTAVPAGVTLDLAGNPRIYNSTVDMGAYEFPLACPPPETTRLYVDHTANGSNTGTNWPDAFEALRDAFTLADNCAGIVEIWVAEGVYRADEGVGIVPDSRTETYQLIDGVAVFGGFEGTETLLEDRDWVGNVTILSGDIDGNDVASGGVVHVPGDIRGANSYHVVVASGVGNTSILDGFTITAGQADGSAVDPEGRGAGIYNDAGSPTLANLSLTGNSAGNGGGLANLNGSSPQLTGVQFTSNAAGSAGGGIYNDASQPALVNGLLSGNYASGNGAAIYNAASGPTLINVTASGNRAGGTAGGMFSTNTSQAILRNSIFWSNQDASGTGTASATIASDPGSEPAIDYSLVQALSAISHSGDHNLDQEPWFTTPLDPSTAPATAGELTLGIFSPAIDAGDNGANSSLADLAGGPRVVNAIIDLGPYEAPYVPIYDTYLPLILRNHTP
jgi:predicted outer membrane repeat protein